MTQNILLASDLESGSEVVFKVAIEQALLTGACIHFLHVFEEIFKKGDEAFGGYQIKDAQQKHINDLQDELKGLMQQHIQRILDHQLKNQKIARDRIEVIVSFGNASKKIVEAANTIKATMIIMGDRRVNALSRFFLGSTAQKVIHIAEIPVLIVPVSKQLNNGGFEELNNG